MLIYLVECHKEKERSKVVCATHLTRKIC